MPVILIISTLILSLLQAGSCQVKAQVDHGQMQLVKGGIFMIGQANGEGDERPVHEVTLDDFYLSKYEVTVKAYKQFCEDTRREMPTTPEWGWIDNHPIINTTWYDAQAYIQWHNEKTGKIFRLPTEAEFEYVLRNGGKPGLYPWSNEKVIEENIADESYAQATGRTNIWEGYDDKFIYTSPVGSFAPNELGVFDINGNMWEWVSDWYGAYPEAPVKNPQGPKSGTHKVGRGASYNADPWHTRTAGRNWVKPEFAKPSFRLAMSVE